AQTGPVDSQRSGRTGVQVAPILPFEAAVALIALDQAYLAPSDHGLSGAEVTAQRMPVGSRPYRAHRDERQNGKGGGRKGTHAFSDEVETVELAAPGDRELILRMLDALLELPAVGGGLAPIDPLELPLGCLELLARPLVVDLVGEHGVVD